MVDLEFLFYSALGAYSGGFLYEALEVLPLIILFWFITLSMLPLSYVLLNAFFVI